MSFVTEYLTGLARCFKEVETLDVETAVAHIIESIHSGGTVYVMGNGGSAATASHIVCDMTAPPKKPGSRRIPAIALTDNAAVISARANDIGYEYVFSEQLAALIKPGDAVIAISASGNSPNILEAVRLANEAHAVTIGLAGFNGGALKDICTVCLTLSSNRYEQVEDIHMALGHIISLAVKQNI